MQLQNPEKNQELQILIRQCNEVNIAFDKVQHRMVEINANIDKNKKIITALEEENSELQAKMDKITVSDVGEVDFSEFDDFSDEMNKNNRKIKALERVIAKFEKEFDYSLHIEYKEIASKKHSLEEKIYDLIGFELLNEFISDSTIYQKIKDIYSILYHSTTILDRHPSKSKEEAIAMFFQNSIQKCFTYQRPNISNLELIDQKYTVPFLNFKERNEITVNLKQELGK